MQVSESKQHKWSEVRTIEIKGQALEIVPAYK